MRASKTPLPTMAYPHLEVFDEESLSYSEGEGDDSLIPYPSPFISPAIGLDDIVYRTQPSAKKINQYYIGNKVGEGAWGSVKEGVDSITLRRVAVKVVRRKQLRKVAEGELMIKREVGIHARMKHKNVTELIEVLNDEQKGKLYIVMEYMGGGSLQSVMDRAKGRPMPLKQCQMLFKQLLDGLEYIHSMGIVHRDIKPANLMLNPDGVLKISDFGIARYWERDTVPAQDESAPSSLHSMNSYGSFGLSPAIQPPEHASDSDSGSAPRLNPKVDMWAAGITLYFMTTGRYPFNGSSVSSLYDNIAHRHFTIPDEMDPTTENFINGLMEYNEKFRFSVQEAKMHPWMQMNIASDESFIPIIPIEKLHAFTSVFDMFVLDGVDDASDDENTGNQNERARRNSSGSSHRDAKDKKCIIL